MTFEKKKLVSLSNEIENLNYDIEKCEENLSGTKNYCTPSCCCHCFTKYWTMSRHKNYVCMTRKKSDNNTITKLDIIPRCNNLKETCVTERAIVDIVVKKSPFKHDLVKNRRSYKDTKKVDAATDPILFSSKDKNKCSDRPWKVILKDNVNETNSEYWYRGCYIDSDETSCETTSSSDVNQPALSHHCITKRNVSVQCDNFKISPIETIKIILKQLKLRLKDNTFMRDKVDELEHELNKVFDFNINSISVDEEENNSTSKYPNFLTSKKTSPSVSEIDNVSLLKLEESYRELENTCLKLKKERDTSLQILAEKTAELMESKKRETDIKRKFIETDSKIKEFSIKLENYAFSIKNLSDHISKVENENKELKKLEQQMTNIKAILSTVINENKTLLTELQQVTLECNKLRLVRAVNEQKKLPENMCSSSTELLIPEIVKEVETTESKVKEEFSKNSVSANSSKSSPSLVLPPPFLYRSNSISSLKTTSSSSSEVDQFEEKDEIISDIVNQQSLHSIQQTRLTNLNKLKEEVNNIFAEIKQISDDIPSRPVIELNAEDFSSDLSEFNGTGSVKDVHQSDIDKK
ncbi:hypothetical protein O3M35_006739 [Rhynocoris fuscipes]|uniref:Uncharacterized protein n=1 Tax=Rhynocoris fuscipes TaxID=488301 RepID=A0AAW1DKG9_9HEMI